MLKFWTAKIPLVTGALLLLVLCSVKSESAQSDESQSHDDVEIDTPKKRTPGPIQTEEKSLVDNLRWIRKLISRSKQNIVVVNAKLNFTIWLQNLNRIETGIKNQRLSPIVQRAILGSFLDDPQLTTLANSLKDSGKYIPALILNDILFQRQVSTYGPDAHATLLTQHNIGLCLLNLRDYEAALTTFKHVYERWNQVLGPNNPSTLIAQKNIVNVLSGQGKYAEALEVLQLVYPKQIKYLGPLYYSTMWSKQMLVDLRKKLGLSNNVETTTIVTMEA